MIQSIFKKLETVLQGITLEDRPAFNKIAWWLGQPEAGQVINFPTAFIALGEIDLAATGALLYTYEAPFTIHLYTDYQRDNDRVGEADNPLFALTQAVMDALSDCELTGVQPPRSDNNLLMATVSGRLSGTGQTSTRVPRLKQNS